MVRKLTIWKQSDLDFILKYGNKIFESKNIGRSLHVDEIPTQIYFENILINLEVSMIADGCIEKESVPSELFVNTDLFLSCN